jgi:hypothetical protein
MFNSSTWDNFDKMRARWRPPRPWRSAEEAEVIQRFVLLWVTCKDRSRPSGRSWARQLNISHTWLQKLAARFETNPIEATGLRLLGHPSFRDLEGARRSSQALAERGLLRTRRRRLSREQRLA